MPIILATQETESRKTEVQSWPGKQYATPYLGKKKNRQKGLVEQLKV
jgi:hypothetical protein